MGVPVITGPHLQNFSEVADILRQADSLKEVKSAEELPLLLEQLWADKAACQVMTNAALAVVEANKGAMNKQLTLVESLLS